MHSKHFSNRFFIGLLAGLLVLSAAAGMLLRHSRPSGKQVVVTVDGMVWGRFDLHTDCTVEISPRDGSWHNTLKIEDSKADIVESDCENQICVITPPLSEDTVGLIVCLPHGLVLELDDRIRSEP